MNHQMIIRASGEKAGFTLDCSCGTVILTAGDADVPYIKVLEAATEHLVPGIPAAFLKLLG